jgi:hypothetical protein
MATVAALRAQLEQSRRYDAQQHYGMVPRTSLNVSKNSEKFFRREGVRRAPCIQKWLSEGTLRGIEAQSIG